MSRPSAHRRGLTVHTMPPQARLAPMGWLVVLVGWLVLLLVLVVFWGGVFLMAWALARIVGDVLAGLS